jgi:hypothetical protein
MNLLPFTTLALAQVHPETKGRMTSPDMMLAFLTTFDLVHILDTPAENPNTPVTKEAKGLRKAFTFGSEFNLIVGHPASQLALLTQMKDDVIVPQAFVDYCVAYANPVSYPNATATQADFDEAHDAGEVIVLPSVLVQHSIQVNTTVQPRKETTLIIEHRFGTDAANLTDWHNIGSVQNVFYPTSLKGAPYVSPQVPATTAAYRELRLVSPLTLGVSIRNSDL